MFDEFENIHSPYEVIKSVGFELVTTNESGGEEKFKLRVDVVRFLDAGDLAPMVWQVADSIGDVLLLHTWPTASPIRGNDPDEVIREVMRSLVKPKTAEPLPGD